MRILFFGRLAESLGRELELEATRCSTVADVRRELARLHPLSAADLAATRTRACVNDETGSEERVVRPADELSFLPPLSGG